MRLLKKLISEKGQLSMEVGILVAAAVLVAIIAGYYYVKNAGTAAKKAGNQTEKFVNLTENKSSEYIEDLNSTLNNL